MRPRVFMSRSRASMSGPLSCVTGSRLVAWLHAVTKAFRVSGYTSGVVTSFSRRQPTTRASTDDNMAAIMPDQPADPWHDDLPTQMTGSGDGSGNPMRELWWHPRVGGRGSSVSPGAHLAALHVRAGGRHQGHPGRIADPGPGRARGVGALGRAVPVGSRLGGVGGRR